MDSMKEDACKIHKLIPWVGTVDEIISYMRKIPLDYHHLRNQVTLSHFLEQLEVQDVNLEMVIRQEAMEITHLLKEDVYYEDIKNSLSALANLHNRKEIILRQFLHKNRNNLSSIKDEIKSKRKQQEAPLKVIFKRLKSGSTVIVDKNDNNAGPITDNNDTFVLHNPSTNENLSSTSSGIGWNLNRPRRTASCTITKDVDSENTWKHIPDSSTNNHQVQSAETYLFPTAGSILYEHGNKMTKCSTKMLDMPIIATEDSASSTGDLDLSSASENTFSSTNILDRRMNTVAANETTTSATLLDLKSTSPETSNELPDSANLEKAGDSQTTVVYGSLGSDSTDVVPDSNSHINEGPSSTTITPNSFQRYPFNFDPSTSRHTNVLNTENFHSSEPKDEPYPDESVTVSKEKRIKDIISTFPPLPSEDIKSSLVNNVASSSNSSNFVVDQAKPTVPNIGNASGAQSTADYNKQIQAILATFPPLPSEEKISSVINVPAPSDRISNTVSSKARGVSVIPRLVTRSSCRFAIQSEKQRGIALQPSVSKSSSATGSGHADKSTGMDENFNLIEYLKEITAVSEDLITRKCDEFALKINKRPNEETLEFLISNLLNFDDVIELDDSTDTVEVTREEEHRPAKFPKTTNMVTSKVVKNNMPLVVNSQPAQVLPDIAEAELAPHKVIDTAVKKDPQPKQIIKETVNLVNPVPGSSNSKKGKIDEKLVFRLMEMFPEASSDYVRDICQDKKWNDFDDIVTVILSAEDYPKRERPQIPDKEIDPEEQVEILKEFLPDADPTYLRMQCDRYAGDPDGLKFFIEECLQKRSYPTMKDYLRKQQLSAQQKQYTTEFNVENFVNLIPDPKATFTDPNRVIKLDPVSKHYISMFLRNIFDRLTVRIINEVVERNDYSLQKCIRVLNVIMKTKNSLIMKSRRKPSVLPDNVQNIPVLQEVAYVTHKKEIEEYLQARKLKEEEQRRDARSLGLMKTCNCCYDEEVMPKDAIKCGNGCVFCRDCVKKSCEVAVGDGKNDFPCLTDCTSEFGLQTLQNVLPPKMFSKIAQKKALAEVKAAGIEELEMCPFCDFANIPFESDKIFKCLNPECMKESCRLCKEPSHIPLKCDEVEKDEAVKARTYIEDKMTEALLRKCWKCGTKFFKEEGCNKMTCSCGARMCYICGKPVTDYSHFNGMGGDKFHLCPLYSNTIEINKKNVLKGAEEAKAAIDPTKLKIDPSADITQHYNDRVKALPAQERELQLNANRLLIRPPQHGIQFNIQRVHQNVGHRHRHRGHRQRHNDRELYNEFIDYLQDHLDRRN